MLLTLHQLPALSDRIALIRRSIALAYLNQPPIPPGEVAPDLNELHRALFVDRLLQADRKADFKAVGRRFQIYGYCLDDEEILAGYGYKELEPLSRKLIITHGRICKYFLLLLLLLSLLLLFCSLLLMAAVDVLALLLF